jgi:hypothetical protein
MSNRRIPPEVLKFIVYIVAVNTYLQTIAPGDTDPRGIVLGMTTAELTKLNSFVKKLVSGDPLNPGIWDLYQNPDTRTKKTTADYRQLRKDFNVFFRPLLKRMEGSANITDGDRLPLHIVNPSGKHKRPTKRIAYACTAIIRPLGQGRLYVVCRYSEDTKRAGRPAGTTGVEVAYIIETIAEVNTQDAKHPMVEDADSIPNRYISTRAAFTMILGGANAGCRIKLFFRWINSKYPELAGDWSGMIVIILS